MRRTLSLRTRLSAAALTVLMFFSLFSCGSVEVVTGTRDDVQHADESGAGFLAPVATETDEGKVWRETTGLPVETTAPDATTPETTRPAVNTEWIVPSQTTAPVYTSSAEAKTKRVKVLAAGDNIIHESVYKDAAKRAKDGAEYDFVPMYAPVAAKIAAADIAFINHESPMAGKELGISGYPTFNSPREAGQALVDVGFDVINLANNHILDKRVSGARSTVEYVQSLPVTELGVYLDKEDASTLRVTEVNGIRVAWLSYCYGSNNTYNPKTDNIIMPLLDDEATIRLQIQEAKKQADFVIVSAHWGIDDQAAITAAQKQSAAVMAEAGADVILGHHPHIVQSVEWRTNKNGSRTLIAYSLGNFLSTQLYSRNMIGCLFTFTLTKEEDGTLSVQSPLFTPTVNHYSMDRDGLQIYPLEEYSETLAAQHGCKAHSPDFSYEWAVKFVKGIVSAEFLPSFLK